MKRLVLIELNELCPPLLAQWMQAGLLPNFSRFHSESDVFVTESDEPEAPNLEPWIQWYSLHTGLPYKKHGVFHLTDGPKANNPDIWRILQAKGLSVWNCSSMNAARVDGPGAFFLPDPWCDAAQPHPPELGKFYKVVSQQVKEYSNRDRKLSPKDISGFLYFMLTHGLSARTVAAILGQLIAERRDAGRTWKRVALLDKLQFDVFRHYFRKKKPAFSTYFANSTAHLQHTYWRHMQPESFTVRPDAAEIARYKGSILFGYQQMDGLIGDFMSLADEDTVLVFATALSQQPYLKYEAIGGQHFYRPRAVEKLLDDIHVHPIRVEPVMTHQFLARFNSSAEAEDAKQRLSRVTSSAGPVFGFDKADPASLYFGCQLRTQLSPGEKLDLGGNAPHVNFFDAFYQIEGIKSGRHHPDGCLWIKQGTHRVHPEKVSILDVMPTILDYFGLPVSGYDGRSLLRPPQEPARKLA